MTPLSLAERLLYIGLLILSLVALALVTVSPAEFTKTGLVYQGF